MSTDDIIFTVLCVLFGFAAIYGLIKVNQAEREQKELDHKDKGHPIKNKN